MVEVCGIFVHDFSRRALPLACKEEWGSKWGQGFVVQGGKGPWLHMHPKLGSARLVVRATPATFVRASPAMFSKVSLDKVLDQTFAEHLSVVPFLGHVYF
jgi:hypothetical protein